MDRITANPTNDSMNAYTIGTSSPIIQIVFVTPLVLTFVSTSFSIIGGILLIICHQFIHFENQNKRNIRKFILFLTIADLIVASGNFAGAIRYYEFFDDKNYTIKQHEGFCEHPENVCVVQSAVSTFGSNASYFWTLSIGIFFLFTRRAVLIQRIEKGIFVHAVCWGVPGVIVVTAIFNDVFGENYLRATSTWCWIKACMERDKVILWMTITGKMWEMLTLVFTVVVYITLKIELMRARANHGVDVHRLHELRNEGEQFMCMWMILLLMRIWGLLRYFLMVTNSDDEFLSSTNLNTLDQVLQSFQSIGDSLMAFCNFVVFVLINKDVRQQIYRRICNRNEYDEI